MIPRTRIAPLAAAGLSLCLSLPLIGCSIFGSGSKDVRGVLSPDADVRREAIVSMGATRDPAAIPVLADRLLKDPDDLVRAASARALGRIRTRTTGPYLVAALKDDSTRVRWDACEALADVQDPATSHDLTKILDSDEDADCRRAAAKALGTLANPDAAEALIAALGDRDEGVRKASLKALERISGKSLGPERAPWEEWYRASRPAGQ
ncbi:MAG: HEAT repeat domain-containing protein [Planctomycetes bacterium]|nr:HEAT repeat domain-containing protein [Planctomycetota bacterium]